MLYYNRVKQGVHFGFCQALMLMTEASFFLSRAENSLNSAKWALDFYWYPLLGVLKTFLSNDSKSLYDNFFLIIGSFASLFLSKSKSMTPSLLHVISLGYFLFSLLGIALFCFDERWDGVIWDLMLIPWLYSIVS